jgi:hypothetical protein
MWMDPAQDPRFAAGAELAGERATLLDYRSLTQRPGAVSAIHSGLLMSTRSREGAVGRRTRRSTYRQEIADTNRSAVEKAIERYLGISTVTAASISLPAFPTGVDPVRLQRVISAVVRFGLLPPGLAFYPITAMLGS